MEEIKLSHPPRHRVRNWAKAAVDPVIALDIVAVSTLVARLISRDDVRSDCFDAWPWLGSYAGKGSKEKKKETRSETVRNGERASL